MFESLKEKFSKTVGKITEKVSSKDKPEEVAETGKTVDEAETIASEEKSETPEAETKAPEKTEAPTEPVEEESASEEEGGSGIFSFFREKKISEKDIEDVLWELEMALLESDVALDVAEKITSDLREELVGKKVKRSTEISEYTLEALKGAVSDVLSVEGKDLDELIETRKPLVIMFVGINGTGKTTTIAKVANYFLKRGLTPVIAAADTFRAGAIEQISHHADKLGVRIISHQKGADPAAVAFDAVSHAKAQGKDVVLIDTAGRMQTNINLMDEMAKIKRVVKPDLIVFVGDALTGNDAVEQAMKFNEAVGIDAVILTKADADARGGAALSIGYMIEKPIIFLGTGQGYDDLMEFRPEWMVNQLFT